jgi:imidazolonepropionase
MTRHILDHLRIASMTPGSGGALIDGAIGIEDGRIAFVGAIPADWADVEREDFGGRVATPALIDCHTHLVFGGNRAREFEMRLEGATYEEIARAGGGIVSTVTQTRALVRG